MIEEAFITLPSPHWLLLSKGRRLRHFCGEIASDPARRPPSEHFPAGIIVSTFENTTSPTETSDCANTFLKTKETRGQPSSHSLRPEPRASAPVEPPFLVQAAQRNVTTSHAYLFIPSIRRHCFYRRLARWWSTRPGGDCCGSSTVAISMANMYVMCAVNAVQRVKMMEEVVQSRTRFCETKANGAAELGMNQG